MGVVIFTLVSGINELSSVHSLDGDEIFGFMSVSVWISEDDSSERSSTAWIVNNILDYSLYVTLSFSIIQHSELCWSNPLGGVGGKKLTATSSALYIKNENKKRCIKNVICCHA